MIWLRFFLLQQSGIFRRIMMTGTIVLALFLLTTLLKCKRRYLPTQCFEIATKDTIKQPMEARNGAFAVPVVLTSHSAMIPAQIATRLLRVVIILNMPLIVEAESSSISLLYSATSQLSNTLQRRVPENPPRMRPRNKMSMSSVRSVKHENEYIVQ
jgi:hypothetical protein